MAKGILGKKIGMTQIFTESGALIPVTVIEVTPNVVLQKKTVETDGYAAVQLGYADKKERLATKPEKGHAAKAQTAPKRFVKEIAGEEMLAFEVGQEVKGNIFVEGELVDVTGTSKGKGYQGVIKRWNYSRGPMSHGSGYHRGTGSMGSIQPARIKPGKKMPGRMGGETSTVQNLEFVKYDAENNVILIKGNVPGAKNSYVVVMNAVKAKKPEVNPEALA
ncbi:MAG: 50S ribosomal protein L3 [Anaeroplasma bactoclasticum]|nr:50S ribosomal protein L3 [Staphylococcus sp.]MCM1350767.1 50S ribosomal protein L3 [Prevotella sp.]MCM1514275.1 50S ribosomal protein L3 [Anaeroplasma bactoclasticum]